MASSCDALAVRHDQPIPNDLGTLLAMGDLRIVAAEDLRTLGDQEVLAGHGVVDVLRYLPDDLTRQIAVEAGDQSGGNDRASLDLVVRERLEQAVLQIDPVIELGPEEGLPLLGGRGPAAGEQILR